MQSSSMKTLSLLLLLAAAGSLRAQETEIEPITRQIPTPDYTIREKGTISIEEMRCSGDTLVPHEGDRLKPAFDITELRYLIRYPDLVDSGSDVTVEAAVNRFGKIATMSIDSSTNNPFEIEVMKALRKMTFVPAVRDRRPIVASICLAVHFKPAANR